MELRFVFEADAEQAIRARLHERRRATPLFEYAFFDTHGPACVKVHCRVAIRPADYRPAAMQHSNREKR